MTVPDRCGLPGGRLFVLVAGWPGSGKSTLAAALAPRLGLPLLAKDEIKEAMMEALGRPAGTARNWIASTQQVVISIALMFGKAAHRYMQGTLLGSADWFGRACAASAAPETFPCAMSCGLAPISEASAHEARRSRRLASASARG